MGAFGFRLLFCMHLFWSVLFVVGHPTTFPQTFKKHQQSSEDVFDDSQQQQSEGQLNEQQQEFSISGKKEKPAWSVDRYL